MWALKATGKMAVILAFLAVGVMHPFIIGWTIVGGLAVGVWILLYVTS